MSLILLLEQQASLGMSLSWGWWKYKKVSGDNKCFLKPRLRNGIPPFFHFVHQGKSRGWISNHNMSKIPLMIRELQSHLARMAIQGEEIVGSTNQSTTYTISKSLFRTTSVNSFPLRYKSPMSNLFNVFSTQRNKSLSSRCLRNLGSRLRNFSASEITDHQISSEHIA